MGVYNEEGDSPAGPTVLSEEEEDELGKPRSTGPSEYYLCEESSGEFVHPGLNDIDEVMSWVRQCPVSGVIYQVYRRLGNNLLPQSRLVELDGGVMIVITAGV